MTTQQAVEKTKERIKAELDQTYWRGCTDGNDGGGWDSAFIDDENNPLNKILLLIDEQVEKSNNRLARKWRSRELDVKTKSYQEGYRMGQIDKALVTNLEEK